MRLLTIFLITICFASCSSELTDSQERENQLNEVIIDKGQKLHLVSQNVDDESINSFLDQVSSQIQEPIEADLPVHLKSNEIEFLPIPWWKGSYYWSNTSKKNITFQTYTVSYQNVEHPDQAMLLIEVRTIDKSNPIKHFYKWQYATDFGEGWEMTCVRAQLIGPGSRISKSDIIVEDEVRVFLRQTPCVFLPEPELTLGWQLGG